MANFPELGKGGACGDETEGEVELWKDREREKDQMIIKFMGKNN